MRHKVRKPKFGRQGDHNKALLKNLVGAVILHGKIKTTEAKAKATKPHVEKLITLARDVENGKKEKREAIRLADKKLFDEKASRRLFDELGKKYAKHDQGGYTRIKKIGLRDGDSAPMVQLELV